MSASAVFYKEFKFHCLNQGHLNLDYRIDPEKGDNHVVCDGADDKDGRSSLVYCILAPTTQNTEEADFSKQFVFA